MKHLMLFWLCLMISSGLFAQSSDRTIAQGSFISISHDAKVKGKAYIKEAANGKDYVYLEDFQIRGGVVLDLKVCGSLDHFPEICLSLGNPSRRGNQSWSIPTNLSAYKKVKIFDADLAYDLAQADLNP